MQSIITIWFTQQARHTRLQMLQCCFTHTLEHEQSAHLQLPRLLWQTAQQPCTLQSTEHTKADAHVHHVLECLCQGIAHPACCLGQLQQGAASGGVLQHPRALHLPHSQRRLGGQLHQAKIADAPPTLLSTRQLCLVCYKQLCLCC
jgi:hypothetical protein